MNNIIRCGFDLGKSIVSREEGYPPFPDCFDVIKQLIQTYGAENNFIVSRVNSSQKERAEKWLEDQNFYDLTGFLRENVYYCFERRDKAMFAAGLKLDVFIDVRPDYLIPMKNIATKLLFNPTMTDLEKFKEDIERNFIQVVGNWKEIEKYLLKA